MQIFWCWNWKLFGDVKKRKFRNNKNGGKQIDVDDDDEADYFLYFPFSFLSLLIFDSFSTVMERSRIFDWISNDLEDE